MCHFLDQKSYNVDTVYWIVVCSSVHFPLNSMHLSQKFGPKARLSDMMTSPSFLGPFVGAHILSHVDFKV